MQVLLDSVISNLTAVGIVFGIYVLTALCYIIASLYYNIIETKRETFDGHKMANGLIKMFSLGLASALLSIVATLIPQYLLTFATGLGMNFGTDTQDVITIAAIIVMYRKAIVSYFTGTLAIISEILEDDIEEIDIATEKFKEDDANIKSDNSVLLSSIIESSIDTLKGTLEKTATPETVTMGDVPANVLNDSQKG